MVRSVNDSKDNKKVCNSTVVKNNHHHNSVSVNKTKLYPDKRLNTAAAAPLTKEQKVVAIRPVTVEPENRCVCVWKCACHCLPKLESTEGYNVCQEMDQKTQMMAGFFSGDDMYDEISEMLNEKTSSDKDKDKDKEGKTEADGKDKDKNKQKIKDKCKGKMNKILNILHNLSNIFKKYLKKYGVFFILGFILLLLLILGNNNNLN